MPSIGHVATGMATARYHRHVGPTRRTLISAMVVWSAISLLPDADVVGFHFGIAYGIRGAIAARRTRACSPHSAVA